MTQLCSLYQTALDLHQRGIHLISTDEMTSIQALERTQPTLPPIPGQVERRAFTYRRHGTQCLIGNLEVATGHLVAPTLGARRTEEDFAPIS